MGAAQNKGPLIQFLALDNVAAMVPDPSLSAAKSNTMLGAASWTVTDVCLRNLAIYRQYSLVINIYVHVYLDKRMKLHGFYNFLFSHEKHNITAINIENVSLVSCKCSLHH